ncbi:MAG: nitrous oxide reductase family maturation protein NosD [Candidatus Accumulibacter sp.]|uniref:nitrous oxide reductase family maturation protein NosD n=1 Tax=Accumulibacter sp. TaxID=2053492 RepID=UPI001A61F79E|nr:nitrous oxide reductase family maturation protein NosD [Accumulibacter sp.]MBL8396112.1 nitrous oxide reductase family maturation protein NosD [Accumulibacter sp.]
MPVANTVRGRRLSWRQCLPHALAITGVAALLTALLGSPGAARTGTPAPSLQAWIDATPAGASLDAPAGTYSGPVIISRPIRIDGRGEVTLDGGGSGSVLTVRASGVTLRGLHLTHSGDSHDRIDSAILIEQGSNNVIENNVIDDVLFGVTLQEANENHIVGNRIRSRPVDPADRGDGIRLWYSMGNRIENNDIARMRDITVSNSLRNRFVGNSIRESRRALNLLFSHRTLIENNRLSDNSTGITALNSDGLIIRRNRIMHAVDASGAGVALKESGTTLIHDNEIIHCAIGVLSDSPIHAINRITLIDNRIAHNFTGVSFYGERGGHLILRNRIEHNLWPALVGEGGRADGNEWRGNYWDSYQGFDLDHDGVGDTPYELWAHADQIWIETPMASFFRNSPALELLDFLERLAPFAPPTLLLRDPEPLVRRSTADDRR